MKYGYEVRAVFGTFTMEERFNSLRVAMMAAKRAVKSNAVVTIAKVSTTDKQEGEE